MANPPSGANPSPDYATRRPASPLPPRTCDCHAHIFGPWDRFPLPAAPTYLPAEVPLEAYLRMLRVLGVGRAVLVQPSPYGSNNAALVAALRSGTFPLRGIALVDDDTPDAQLEALHLAGVHGVRRHLSENPRAALAALPRLAERIKAYGWHLQLLFEGARTPDIDRQLLALPVPIVIDHFGMVPAADGIESPGFQMLLRLARSGRCWFKLTAPYRVSTQSPRFPDVTPFVRALVAAAPDQCVWGTDWPHPNASFMPNDGDLADLLPAWIPDEALRRKILVENPERLYGF
jgi:predicted TIM-barrel fold metal-dependent hydrolase